MLAKVAHDAVMVLKIAMKVVALMQRPVLETQVLAMWNLLRGCRRHMNKFTNIHQSRFLIFAGIIQSISNELFEEKASMDIIRILSHCRYLPACCKPLEEALRRLQKAAQRRRGLLFNLRRSRNWRHVFDSKNWVVAPYSLHGLVYRVAWRICNIKNIDRFVTLCGYISSGHW